MACTAHHSGVLETWSSFSDPCSVSARCCCTVSAWRAPRTLTGSLANTPDSSSFDLYPRSRRRLVSFPKNAFWNRSSKVGFKLKCATQPAAVYSVDELWDLLLPSISYLSATELCKVRTALELAFYAHDGQKRKSGEPYIIHPVEVGRILGELEMDWESIAAGLLHDTVEDTSLVTFERLEEQFGYNVRRIVEGETKVSKLGKIKCCDSESSTHDVQAEDLRQMFLAMTEEVRVIIVKLADRLHNMRTLSFMPPHKQRHIALETLQIFAPLARLLGMYKIKSELDELSFMYAYPTDYADIRKKVDSLFQRQREIILEAKEALMKTLRNDQFLSHVGHDAKVLTLCKEPYSIYKKIKETNCTFEEIGDIAQLRIVLRSKLDISSLQQACYHVLGLVHGLWRPVPQTMKDYIATPKPNGYQSLHTKVIPFCSRAFSPLEIQIRTQEMDKLAEFGIAVHYSGKSITDREKPLAVNGVDGRPNCLNAADLARRVSWLNSIREWQEEFVGNMSSREFVDTVTGDLLGSRVFVFTPKGEIKNLPKGATVIDYAYQVHTEVGNKMVAAKVNGNLVSPTHVLSNAEVVEILTYEGTSNKRHFMRHQRWLQFARTRSARHKLTKFLKEQAALSVMELTADAVKTFLKGASELRHSKDDIRHVIDASNPFISLSGHLKNAVAELTNPPSPYIPKVLPAQNTMMYGARAINGKHSKRLDSTTARLGRGTCIVGSAASSGQQSLTLLNGPSLDETRPTLEAWLIGRLSMWHGLGGPVQWFNICCLDRKSMLTEVTAILSAAGLVICACVAETDRLKGLGIMLFHVEGEVDNLEEACSSIRLLDGVLNWSTGCSWMPAQSYETQYEA